MKERLIIISDLWGREKSEWLINYTRILEVKFDIEFYDSCELGEIDKTAYSRTNLHKQFVEGGIEKAVNKLIAIEKHTVNILAFSIGGTIAWKYGIRSRKINSLICVSSTRLRKETERPSGRLKLYFGENDEFKPEIAWLEKMELDYKILLDKEHQVYCEPEFAKQLSEKIIKATPQHGI